jgi:hypothetical protein
LLAHRSRPDEPAKNDAKNLKPKEPPRRQERQDKKERKPEEKRRESPNLKPQWFFHFLLFFPWRSWRLGGSFENSAKRFVGPT